MVNILGLSVGLASVLIISTYIISELSFDQFHADADRIYRVIEHVKESSGTERDIAKLGGAVAPSAQANVAGVESFMRYAQLGGLNMVYKDKEFEDDFVAVDPNFFSFFDYKLLSGTPEGVFKAPFSVVMSESAAKRYFGDEDPIGKVIKTRVNGDYELTVTGVMEDMPEHSHLNEEILFSFATPDQFFDDFMEHYNNDWNAYNLATYLKLGKEVSPERVAAGINEVAAQNREEDADTFDYWLQPLTDIHFGSDNIDGDRNYRECDQAYVYIFACIGILILAIAFTNYVNLSTIKATDRIKEIGLRRVVGASSRQLITQFMSESIFICLLSAALAFTLLQFAGPLVVLLFGSNLLAFIYTPEYLIATGLLVILLGLAAGLYPALSILKTKTVSALKSQTLAGKKQNFFRGVVLFQFITSLSMITATLVVYNQLDYINNKDLGYDQEALAVIDISSGAARVNQEQILNGFLQDPSVKSVSITSRVPGEWKSYFEITVEDKENNAYSGIPFIGVDEHFLEVYDIPLEAGRNVRTGDTTRVMINQTLAKQLGIEYPEGDAVSLTGIHRSGAQLGFTGSVDFEIVGVIGDFHFQSFHEEIPPMMFGYKLNVLQSIDYFTVKLQAQDMGATMERLKTVMKQFDPSPFGYNFLDDKLGRYYLEDARRSKLFFVAASIAVFIAFIGLFALVHFALQKRLKEMSIRKVLGANIRSLVLLLSADYIKLLLLALAVAVPLSYWGMSGWLDEFVYRAPIHWWIFGLALLVCLIITAITAFTQITKTARRNPADILRQE